MQLNVAATRLVPAQIATGKVAVGQLNLEDVIATWLPFVASADPGRAGGTVDVHVVVDDPASRIVGIDRIARDIL